jgi:hypothetical protein
MATCGSDTIVTAEYRGETAVAYARCVSVSGDGFDLSLGMTEPVLEEPIDYEAEMAARRQTHEPLEEFDGHIGNSAFGI